MKKYISTSPALVVTALMVTLSFGCGEGIEGDTESQSAQLTTGQCNAVVANALGAAQECFRSTDSVDECKDGDDACVEVTGALEGFLGNSDCVGAILSGDLNGLPGGNASQHRLDGPKEGALKHVGKVICTAIEDCAQCLLLPEGFCPGFC